MMTTPHVLRGLAIAALLLGLAACQRDASPGGPAGPLSTADGPGVLTGRMTFTGTPPPRQELRVSADPNCLTGGDPPLSEAVVVGDEGGLRDVFVYVKEGLGDRQYAAPEEPVVLDQDGCRYIPHVFGVQVGQPVRILNSDPTMHNVHATTKSGNFFNFTQMAGQGPATRTFTEPEVMVPVRCDVHGWMIAYAGVVTHPFHAVTGEDGTFTIRGLPAGSYTVEAWHGRLGVQSAEVTISDEAPEATVGFSFAAE